MAENLPVITKDDLALVEDNLLNEKQLQFLLTKTPSKFVRKRPAKGGGQWDYVSGAYVKKVLNLIFGFQWSFEIIDEMIRDGEAIVKGKLTCQCGDRTIVKMQYGNKDIICKKNTEKPLSIGNDLKAAATDSLKKCASEIGIAADIYGKDEFKEVKIKGVEPATKNYK